MAVSSSSATRRHVAGGLSLTDEGEGPAVLLLHGIGGSARSCTALGSALAGRGVRALAWDAPGYGESADPATRVRVTSPLRWMGV